MRRLASLTVILLLARAAHADDARLFSFFAAGVTTGTEVGLGIDGNFALGVELASSYDLSIVFVGRGIEHHGDTAEIGLGARVGSVSKLHGWLVQYGLSLHQLALVEGLLAETHSALTEAALDVSVGKRRQGWRGPISGYVRIAGRETFDSMTDHPDVLVTLGVRCDFTRR